MRENRQDKKHDYTVATLLGLFGVSVGTRIAYEIYQIHKRVNKLENALESRDVLPIQQKPILETDKFFIISSFPKQIPLHKNEFFSLTLFTKPNYLIVPKSLKVNSITKFDEKKLNCAIVSQSDVSQNDKMLNIDFEILGIQKGKYNLVIDTSFQIQEILSKTVHTINRKISIPLHF